MAPYFKSIKIRGVTYDLSHLEPLTFPVAVDNNAYNVRVIFSCHCFTEGLTEAHTPDLRYKHEHETRAFCVKRHGYSKSLPQLIQLLGSRSVYFGKGQRNFFHLNDGEITGTAGAYVVFFNVGRSTSKAYNVIMNVESAYAKPGMALEASPVKFTTLIKATAIGTPIKAGPSVKIKRK